MSTEPANEETPVDKETEAENTIPPPADPVEQIKDQGEPAGGNFA